MFGFFVQLYVEVQVHSESEKGNANEVIRKNLRRNHSDAFDWNLLCLSVNIQAQRRIKRKLSAVQKVYCCSDGKRIRAGQSKIA